MKNNRIAIILSIGLFHRFSLWSLSDDNRRNMHVNYHLRLVWSNFNTDISWWLLLSRCTSPTLLEISKCNSCDLVWRKLFLTHLKTNLLFKTTILCMQNKRYKKKTKYTIHIHYICLITFKNIKRIHYILKMFEKINVSHGNPEKNNQNIKYRWL